MTLEHGTLGAMTDRDYRVVKRNLERVLRRLKLGPHAEDAAIISRTSPVSEDRRQGKSAESKAERIAKFKAWLADKRA